MSAKKYEVFNGLSKERLEDILGRIKNVRTAIIGDICLDIYWKADMTKSELSRETPHFPLPVVEEWMSLGGGGNAAANIAALNPSKVYLFGIIGMDWRGDILQKEIESKNIVSEGIVKSSTRVTNAYCKPLRKGISNVEYEDPRIDFENYEPVSVEDEADLIELLDQTVQDIDVLCVSDQMKFGCITPLVRKKINHLAAQGLRIVVDSRDRITEYRYVTLKPNELEGLRAVGNKSNPKNEKLEDLFECAKALSAKNESHVCMTLGERGCVTVEGRRIVHIPTYMVPPPLDTCGAGDTFIAAFACSKAADTEIFEAAAFANLAANVTIKKLGTTGTASPREIITRHEQILGSEKQNEPQIRF